MTSELARVLNRRPACQLVHNAGPVAGLPGCVYVIATHPYPMAVKKTSTQRREKIASDFVEGVFRYRDWTTLHSLVRDGIALGAFRAPTVDRFVRCAVHGEENQVALRYSIVSERSWKRRVVEKTPLSPAEVVRMTDVGEVVREARRVYGGDEDAADRFLTQPHPRLQSRPPVLVAASEAGAQAVRELLARMEEGAPV